MTAVCTHVHDVRIIENICSDIFWCRMQVDIVYSLHWLTSNNNIDWQKINNKHQIQTIQNQNSKGKKNTKGKMDMTCISVEEWSDSLEY